MTKVQGSFDSAKMIGEYSLRPISFPTMESVVDRFCSDGFKAKNSIERSHIVNETLCDLILRFEDESYLLREVVDYLECVSQNKVLDGNYNLTAFERWLNQHSGLSYEENRRIRGKIVGKYIPRQDYQVMFPVGHEKVHPGTHTVTAHNPPDLDSTTASFVGWLDAFGCRVGDALTVWNVPQGEPGPVIAKIFNDTFSPTLFKRVAKRKSVISHVGMDLVKQSRMIKVTGEASIRDFRHNRIENHITLIDDDGYYIGDWRVTDVEAVGRVQRLLNICMHLYEKEVVLSVTKVLADPEVTQEKVKAQLDSLCRRAVPEPNLNYYTFEEEDYETLDTYLKKVLGIQEGCKTAFSKFFDMMDEVAGARFKEYRGAIRSLLDDELYDKDGMACNPSAFFQRFSRAYEILMDSTRGLREYLDRIDVAIKVKSDVLGFPRTAISTKADLDEIRSICRSYPHVTVIFPSKCGRLVPVGVLHRDDVFRAVVGTVSLRDFCNTDEIKLGKSLAVISAIDHHKSTLDSKECMTLSIADVQSCNVIAAEFAFDVNDRYGLRGQSEESVNEQLAELQEDLSSAKSFRLLEKLLRKKQAIQRRKGGHFVDPEREYMEYEYFLNAIIDDTDLLNKADWRDLECVAELLNRMKSFLVGYECEIIALDDLPKLKENRKTAIERFLKNDDLYSFYKGIYAHREEVVSQWIEETEPTKKSHCFDDRKIQNEVCSVSQLKLFSNNWDVFVKNRQSLMEKWLEVNHDAHQKSSEVDFFLNMISTIPGAEEAYRGESLGAKHEDELWIAIDTRSDNATSRFREFLTVIQTAPKYKDIDLHLVVEGAVGASRDDYETLIKTNFENFDYEVVDNVDLSQPIVVFKFAQGNLNSRKADITPFLPVASS